MAEVKSVVCDICGGADAHRWMLARNPAAPWVIDLCITCEQPLVDMREHSSGGASGRRPYRKYAKRPVKGP